MLNLSQHKNKIIGLLFITTVLFAWLAFSPTSLVATSVSKSWFGFEVSGISSITCTYPQMLYATFNEGEVTHELPAPETNPIVITYSDFDAEISTARFIDATQSISEVALVKLLDNEEKMIFIEGDGNPYMSVHTIYKETGVSTLSKSVSFLGIPSGRISMGTCMNS